MWEWRIFSRDDLLAQLPEEFRFSSNEFEERTDYYYNYSHPGYGLKERIEESDHGNSPKLELKVRYDRTHDGIEYWDKIISETIPQHGQKHVSQNQIEDVLETYSEEGSPYEYAVQSFLNYINGKPSIIEVQKRRVKVEFYSNDNLIKFEYFESRIEGKLFYGISIESEDEHQLRQFVHNLDIEVDGIVQGYPGFIHYLFQEQVVTA